MSVESAEFIKDLVTSNPSGTDPVSEGDEHIRMIKRVLKNSFSLIGIPRVQKNMAEGPEWEGESYSGRWSNWTTIGDPIVVSDISPDAETVIIDISGSGGISGGGVHHKLEIKMVKSDGTDLSTPYTIVGFNHANDPATFEVISSFLFRTILDSPPTPEFTFSIQCADLEEEEAGCHVDHLSVTVTEYS